MAGQTASPVRAGGEIPASSEIHMPVPGEAFPPFDPTDKSLAALIATMRRFRPLALVGAGASAASGYPDWAALLDKLGREAEQLAKRGEIEVAPKALSAIRRLQDPAWQAEEFSRILTPERFGAILGSTFGDPEGGVRDPHHLIAALGFRHFLTTNFERCIELALKAATRTEPGVVRWNCADQVRGFFADLNDPEAKPSVVYLHGRYDQPDSLVLTETGYRRTYLQEDVKRRLLALFMIQPVVIIGFSMNDPDLGQLMREVLASLGSGDGPDGETRSRIQHFGIFGYETADEMELIRSRMKGKYGLDTVFYRLVVQPGPTKKISHENLLPLLEHLLEKTGRSLPALKAPASPRKPLPPVPLGAPKVVGFAAAQRRMPLDRGEPAVAGTAERGRPAKPPTEAPKATEAQTWSAPIEPGLYDLDPNKGRFGGHAEDSVRGRRVGIANIRDEVPDAVLTFDLVVERLPGKPQLKGRVTADLHPTFKPARITLPVSGGRACARITAVGAFTIGIRADGGKTRLELDLAEVKALPDWFRKR